jgi:hypothetical protein
MSRAPFSKPHPDPLLKKEREQPPLLLPRIFSIHLSDPTIFQRLALFQSVEVHKYQCML